MHRARAFFYVAAGVFLLALSFQLGARSAGAQSGSFFRVLNSSNPLVIETGGVVYAFDGSRWLQPPTAPPPVAASSLVVGNTGTYMTADGTTWVWGNPAPGWNTVPPPGSGPVPAQREAWGAVKARYR